MAKIIDDETMENVCILAKLSLTEDEKEKAKEDMQKMLDYVDNYIRAPQIHSDIFSSQSTKPVYQRPSGHGQL